jgi:hypothetical protein
MNKRSEINTTNTNRYQKKTSQREIKHAVFAKILKKLKKLHFGHLT